MKKKVAVFFGGKSAEHDVSIITAHNPIIESLLALGTYEVYPVYISRKGGWYSEPGMNSLDYFKESNLDNFGEDKKKIQILFDDGLKLIWPGLIPKSVKIDVAFTSMHGTYGEDGSLMGVFRMAGVPFVGCDLFASAVSMDKVLTKQVLWADGLPVVPYVWFTKDDWNKNKQSFVEAISKLKLPLFIKPVHLGSSIGITKIKDMASLENAVEVAMHYDDKVLVEEGVENLIEVTLPIIGNNELKLGGVERPLNKTEFFDFSDKYLSSGGKKGGGVNNQYSEIPAKIGDELLGEVKELGQRTYKVLGCSGISRVDFLIDGLSKKVYVNEVNNLPGSLYAHNWKTMGLSSLELVERLVRLAEERFNDNQETTYTFDSNILQQAGGRKIR